MWHKNGYYRSTASRTVAGEGVGIGPRITTERPNVPVIDILPVILADGSGTKLWPPSCECHPNPLLRLSGAETLLQETARWARDFSAVREVADPVVTTTEE